MKEVGITMKAKPLLALLFTMFILLACSSNTDQCPLPQEKISEADLVGTWTAKRSESTDTLVIREDGAYKQILHLEIPEVDYESEWLSWQLEYSESGTTYLHMEDLRLCAYLPDIMDCEQVGGGEFYFYDFCREKSVSMVDEGILIVLGVSKTYTGQVSHDIRLTLLLAWPERVWTYELVNP